MNRYTYTDDIPFMGHGKFHAYPPTPALVFYTTNQQGEGLFAQRRSDGDIKQMIGTGEFIPFDFAQF